MSDSQGIIFSVDRRPLESRLIVVAQIFDWLEGLDGDIQRWHGHELTLSSASCLPRGTETAINIAHFATMASNF